MAFCVLTYALNLLPYIAVNRSAFCYHYMPALMYAELLSALTIDRLFGEGACGFGVGVVPLKKGIQLWFLLLCDGF